MNTQTTNNNILPRDFYLRDTVTVARELLGKRVVNIVNGLRVSGIITETEAYLGETDSACHASKGRTPRTAIMFGPGGYSYVYLCYGMHHMLNIVTAPQGQGEAVLVRVLRPQENMDVMRISRKTGGNDKHLADGPGKLCQALNIYKDSHNGLDLTTGEKLWLEPCAWVDPCQISAAPRIGIDYARPQDRDALLRFTLHL